MSFGFSVGDFLAVAQLAYTLGKSLSYSKGASKEYQELITELNVVHKVLLQVDELLKFEFGSEVHESVAAEAQML
jgi:hypothetical protein